MSHEWTLIDRIRQHAGGSSAVALGIGDDCAVQTISPGALLLVGKDVLLEGTHFELSTTTPELVGRKALAVNLSDIAAMGGIPRTAFVGLALPRSGGLELAERLMQGVQQLASEYDAVIAGGDTNIWNGPLVVSVTLLGEVLPPGPVTRSGARPGDWIFVTGRLGGSLNRQRHLTFTPRVREAQQLLQQAPLHAMIDLSDGLSSDLKHIVEESRVGAVIDSSAIPIHDDVPASLPIHERLQHALSNGEDFELLFTVSPEAGRLLEGTSLAGTPLTRIGEIRTGSGMVLRSPDGTEISLEASGWEHRFDD